jgi:heterodisulfide reductase subunit C
MSSTSLKCTTQPQRTFVQEIMERSEQNLLACYQCRKCAAGCPVGEESGVTPDQLIRMILFGEKDEAINNLLVWKCVACYTCGARCPNNIQTARINETLKQMSKEVHAEPLLPKVAAFHKAFMKSASHFGRLNEMEFMGLYGMDTSGQAIKRGKWKAVFDDMRETSRLGMAMMKKRRMHFGFSKVRKLSEVKGFYKKAQKSGSSEGQK